MFYSKQTKGFYDPDIHENIPADAVEITKEEHAALLDLQSQGYIIQADENGNPVAVDPPAPTEEQVVKLYMDAVQLHMDATAVQYGYDDLKSVVTYADEPIVPRYQKEGQGFREWRSLCWAYCEQVFADVKNGLRTSPSYEELIAELPELIITY